MIAGVVTGGVRAPKSLDGPLIASARALRPARLVSGVPASSVRRNVTVTAPPGLPLAESSSPTRPVSCIERCGTVCAPATERPNSDPLGTWQSVAQKASGSGPAAWFFPGGPAAVDISLGFTLSWQPVHAEVEAFAR